MCVGMVASSQTAISNGQTGKRIGGEEAWHGTPICKTQAVDVCSQWHGDGSVDAVHMGTAKSAILNPDQAINRHIQCPCGRKEDKLTSACYCLGPQTSG